jgi:hypothetical protein
MAVDTAVLADLCASAVEAVDRDWGDTYTIRTAALIIEIDSPKQGQLIIRASDDRPWVQRAFLEEAVDVIDAWRDKANDEPTDDEE